MTLVAYKIPEDELAALRSKTKSATIAATPAKSQPWPTWARAIASKRTPDDLGVGDTIHRKLGEFGQAYKATLAALGVPCRCDERQDEYNAKYPYSALANQPEK